MSNDEYTSVSLLSTKLNLKDKHIVCYPYYVVELKVTMNRPMLKPKVVITIVTVDLIRSVAMRSDIFPEYRTVDILSESLIGPMVSKDEAEEAAKNLAFKWSISKFHLMRAPMIEISKAACVYKPYCMIEKDGKHLIIDPLKGILEGIEL